jgi:hypothetical protein
MNAAEAARGLADVALPEDFFTAPSHHAARLLRHMWAPENVAATMEASSWGLFWLPPLWRCLIWQHCWPPYTCGRPRTWPPPWRCTPSLFWLHPLALPRPPAVLPASTAVDLSCCHRSFMFYVYASSFGGDGCTPVPTQ